MARCSSTSTCPETPPPQERLDIKVIEGDKVTVVDICCPFDNGCGALQAAAAAEVLKYKTLESALAAAGKDVKYTASLSGPLGSGYQPTRVCSGVYLQALPGLDATSLLP